MDVHFYDIHNGLYGGNYTFHIPDQAFGNMMVDGHNIHGEFVDKYGHGTIVGNYCYGYGQFTSLNFIKQYVNSNCGVYWHYAGPYNTRDYNVEGQVQGRSGECIGSFVAHYVPSTRVKHLNE